MARDVFRLREHDRASSSHRLRLGADGQNIEWVSKADDGRDVVTPDEPEASWLLRLRLWLTSHLVGEELL